MLYTYSPTSAALFRCVSDVSPALRFSGRNIKLTFDSPCRSAAGSWIPFHPPSQHTHPVSVCLEPPSASPPRDLNMVRSLFALPSLCSRLREFIPHKEQMFLSMLNAQHVSPLWNGPVASRSNRRVGVCDGEDFLFPRALTLWCRFSQLKSFRTHRRMQTLWPLAHVSLRKRTPKDD